MNHTAWLEDFLALHMTGNFSRAADIRHTSQSAFSRRIRALEEWVGKPLFNRTPQKVLLTPAGENFYPAVSSALAVLKQGLSASRETGKPEDKTLKIAATHTLSLNFFPKWFARHEGKVGVESIQLLSDTMSSCEGQLTEGKVHFFLGYDYSNPEDQICARHFESKIIGQDILIPVHAAHFDSQSSANIDRPGQDQATPYLAYTDESGIGKILKQSKVFSAFKVQHNTTFTSHLASALKIMALSGRGIAWLPKSLIEAELASGLLIPFSNQDAHLKISVRLFRSSTPLTDIGEKLWNLVSATPKTPIASEMPERYAIYS